MAMERFLSEQGARYIVERVKEKAPIASPELTGTPKAPTAEAGTNNTQIATTAFVSEAIENAKLNTYTVKGNVDDPADLPSDAEPGDIYQVNSETVFGEDGSIKKVVGEVEEYPDLSTLDPPAETGDVYRVKQAGRTDELDETTAFPENTYFEKTDAGWEKINGTGYPEKTNYVFTENDGWQPREDGGIDLSKYATKDDVNERIRYDEFEPIALADVISWFNVSASPTYTIVTDTVGKNPKQEGWYIKVGDDYELTDDATPQDGIDYYEKA